MTRASRSPAASRAPAHEDIDVPDFLPWLPQRYSVAGWTPDRHMRFMVELARIGSVRAAARAVGKSARSAYLLRERPGAEHFAVAWDKAVARGRQHGFDHAIDRALHGEKVLVYWHGKVVGHYRRYNDSLSIAALGAGRATFDPIRDDYEAACDRLERYDEALRRRELELDEAGSTKSTPSAFDHGMAMYNQKHKRRSARHG